MTRRFSNRLRSIGRAVIRRWWIALGGVLGGALLWVINELASNALSDYVFGQLPRLYPLLTPLAEWASRNPDRLILVVVNVALVGLFFLTYFETRPPRGLQFEPAEPIDDLGVWLGVKVTNHMGRDLQECWVDVTGWGGEEAQARRTTRLKNRYVGPSGLTNDDTLTVYFVHCWNGSKKATLIESNGPQLQDGITEVQLSFHALTLDDVTITTPFWVDIRVAAHKDDWDEIEIVRVTT